ncbi:MAG: SCP2 sterol-binding domain-containing protein [Proteobacteria bacterium]|nr:SCP2 sterol-binding domain-containing protein [Pseudomonadota bacterium]
MTKDELKEKIGESLLNTLKGPLKVMPLWMEATALGVFIDKILRENPRLAKRLVELTGKTFLFEATDVKKSFYLLIEDERVKVIPHMSKEPDVVMKGEFKTLVGLLVGKEDADTVFFSRKLQINGDTAVALHLKNILNSL